MSDFVVITGFGAEKKVTIKAPTHVTMGVICALISQGMTEITVEWGETKEHSKG